ncbi:hypothetical protein EV715DRAFT_215052 [Schizophyllum commune]
MDRYDNGTTPSEIYDINQLEAMRLAETAWDEVTPQTIRNCWIKTGILPASLSRSTDTVAATAAAADLMRQAETDVANALDVLQASGALQSANRLPVHELVDSPAEVLRLDDGDEDDGDIAAAVMESRKAIEMGPANGGDDDMDDDAVVEPLPTRREALTAAATLSRYLTTVGESNARKLDVLFASFTRSVRAEVMRDMRVAKISDFFTRT